MAVVQTGLRQPRTSWIERDIDRLMSWSIDTEWTEDLPLRSFVAMLRHRYRQSTWRSLMSGKQADAEPKIAIRDDTRVPGEIPPAPNPAAPKVKQESAIEHEPEHV